MIEMNFNKMCVYEVETINDILGIAFVIENGKITDIEGIIKIEQGCVK